MIFLDVTIRANQGEFFASLYCKSLDGHQFLDFDLRHPSHTKSSIAFGSAPRMRRICSKKSDLFANAKQLNKCFIQGK